MGGVLYIENNFFVPSFAPSILNIFLILGVWVSIKFFKQPIFALSYIVLLAGFAQCLWHYIFLKNRLSFRPSLGIFSDEAVVKVFKLSLPRIWGVAVYHINLLADTIIASFSNIVGQGAVAAIYYSNRLIQLPLAIFAMSVSRAVMPKLSLSTADDKRQEFVSILKTSFKGLSFCLIPTSFLFGIFANKLIIVIFKRGEFDEYSVLITVSCLIFYSLGLFFFGISRLFTSAFYALQDTSTPAKVASITLVINIVLSLLFMFPLKVGGIALASSIASMVNFLILEKILRRRYKIIELKEIKELFKIILASLVMIISLFLAISSVNFANMFLELTFIFIFSAVVFFVGALLFKIEYTDKLVQWILKRK